MSSIWHSVSSPDATPRSSSIILRCASYFQLFSQCFIWWWNTASDAWYFTSIYARCIRDLIPAMSLLTNNLFWRRQVLLALPANSSAFSFASKISFICTHFNPFKRLIGHEISCTITLYHFNSGTQPRSQGSPLYPFLRRGERDG